MFENVRRWQWMLLSIVVGLLVGLVRSQFDEVDPGRRSLNQGDFEIALVRKENVQGGAKPQFMDPRVYRVRMPDLRYVVKGLYADPRDVKSTPEGKISVTWTEAIWVPDQLKYTPIRKVPARKESIPGALEVVQTLLEKVKLKDPDPPGTVIDYLKDLKAAEGVEFRYEWWRQPRISMAMWTTASFVVIGLVWPSVINVIMFGSIFRPAGYYAALRKVRGRKAAADPKRSLTDAELERIRAMGDAMEADLLASGTHRDTAAPATEAPAPVKPLNPEPVKAAEESAASTSTKAIGMDKDDFYPTEVHAKPPERR